MPAHPLPATQMDARFVEIGELVRTRLSARPRGVIAMGHAWFGIQLLSHMGAKMMYALDIGVQFHLGRAWRAFRCMGLQPPPFSELATEADIVRRPWHPDTLHNNRLWNNASFPPRVTFPAPGALKGFPERPSSMQARVRWVARASVR